MERLQKYTNTMSLMLEVGTCILKMRSGNAQYNPNRVLFNQAMAAFCVHSLLNGEPAAPYNISMVALEARTQTPNDDV
mgnify:CR=1 FL=1